MNKYERAEKYGWPQRIGDYAPNVLQFEHESEEGARLSSQANIDEYGHPSWVENRNGIWVSVVDLNPALAQTFDE